MNATTQLSGVSSPFSLRFAEPLFRGMDGPPCLAMRVSKNARTTVPAKPDSGGIYPMLFLVKVTSAE
jgi:hypothetical protein